jgi:Skp family chaperone for outer membrane proteins
VKKSVGIVVGVATLGLTVYVGSHLWAQQGNVRQAGATAPAAAPRTKVAVFNMKWVVTNWSRYKNFQNDLKRAFEDYKGKIDAKTTALEGLKKAAETADPASKEAKMKEFRKANSELQELKEEAQTNLAKQEADGVVTLYGEVAQVVSQYAQSNDLELVMHYSDGVNAVEMNHPQNIGQKMMARSCTPMYWTNGIDISQEIWKALESRYKAAQTPAGGSAHP